jgi:hypothetical protein
LTHVRHIEVIVFRRPLRRSGIHRSALLKAQFHTFC